MAPHTLTVEDCSPLITFDPPGAWSDSSPDDPLVPSYSGQSYHATSTQGATATIDFYGTGLTIIGGKRPSYGQFVASVDGNQGFDGTAQASENITKQTLGTISGLQPGKHRVVFENVNGSPIDLDAVIITDDIGPPQVKMEAKTYDDMDPLMTYSPPAAWGTNRLPIFQDATIHFSQDPNAAASMQFTGDAVAIYGTIAPDHADMKVTVDRESTILRGGSSGGVNQLHPQVLLYYRSGLGPGAHSLNFAAQSPVAAAPFIDLDSVVVFSQALASSSVIPPPTRTDLSSAARTSSTSTGSSANSSNKGNSGGIPKGALAGAIVAGIAGLLACIALAFLAWRWRQRRRGGSGGIGFSIARSDSPISPDLPMQQEPRRLEAGMISMPLENSVFVFPPKPGKARLDNSRHSIAPSYYSSPEGGSGHRSLPSTSSGSPLLRPLGMRTVPAKAFRNGTGLPSRPRVPVPLQSSISSELSQEESLENRQRSPRRPVRRPTPIEFDD